MKVVYFSLTGNVRRFVEKLERELGKPVGIGVFAANMRISLVNDGPVTIFVDSRCPE